MRLSRMPLLLFIIIPGLAAWASLQWHLQKSNRELETITSSPMVNAGARIDHATVAAYQNLGATHGARWAGDGGLHFEIGSTIVAVDGFQFDAFPKAKLPDVSVPFGLNFVKAVVSDTDLKKLGHLKNLTLIEMDPKQVTDASLRALREVGLIHALNLAALEWPYARPDSDKSVQCFYLAGTQVTDEGLRELASFENLTELSLSASQATDEGLKHLSRFKKLTKLQLAAANITERGYKELVRHKNLKGLTLYNANVPTAGLKELAPLKALTRLGLDDQQLTDSSLGVLLDNDLLHCLPIVEKTRVKAGQGSYANQIEEIALERTRVTDVGLKRLTSLQNLKTLSLNKYITDAGLKELAPLKNLKTLRLGAAITDAGLAELAALRGLIALELGEARVTDAGLKALVAVPHIERLDLSRARITGAGLKDLSVLTKLNHLQLYESDVTDEGIQGLANLKSLKFLNMMGCRHVTDASVKELAALQNVTMLELRGTKVTKAGFAELSRALPNTTIYVDLSLRVSE